MSPVGISVPADPPPTHDAKARRAWIRYRLSLRDSTMTALASAEGVTQAAVASAALGVGSRHLMRALALACETPPGTLFPEHFDNSGAMRRKSRRMRRQHGTPAEGVPA